MKNIIKIFAILFVSLTTMSCEPDEYVKPNLKETPVYLVSEVENAKDNKLYGVTIYREKAMLAKYHEEKLLKMYDTKDYVDSSTDTEFNVSVIATEVVPSKVEGEADKTVEHSYAVVADKVTGMGTLTYSVDGATKTMTVRFKASMKLID